MQNQIPLEIIDDDDDAGAGGVQYIQDFDTSSWAVPNENPDQYSGYNVPPTQYSIQQSAQRSEGELRIHNVLALAVLECDRKVELDDAINHFVNASYNPEQFPALRIEVRGPLTQTLYTVSLFDGGRIQSAGGCMPREAGMCMKQVARRLRDRLGVAIKFKKFEIHNLLGVIDVGCEISLPKLFSLVPGQKDFEPTKFPALRVCIPVPQVVKSDVSNSASQEPTEKLSAVATRKREAARLTQKEKKRKVETITASVFANGKINFVGGKSVRSIVAVLNELRPFIEACT